MILRSILNRFECFSVQRKTLDSSVRWNDGSSLESASIPTVAPAHAGVQRLLST